MAVVKRSMPAGTPVKRKLEAVEEKVSLPTERSTPSTNLWDYSILLFGEKKIGKTDLTAQAPRTFHLMTEPGGKAQRIFQRPVTAWNEYLAYVRLLEKDTGRARQFDTVSVDTVDLLYKLCFDHVCRVNGFVHPQDEAYGKGWAAIRNEFEKGVTRLLNIDKGVVFISHATEREMKMRDGTTYDKLMPTLSGQGRDIVEGLVDLWFYYGYEGRDRVLTITGSDHVGAGHRLKDRFRYPDGAPVNEIAMGTSAEEGYANLLLAFNNQYTGRQRAAEPPTAEKKILKKKKKV